MFTNRISQYLNPDDSHSALAQPQPGPRKPKKIPPGFTQLPENLLSSPANLYQQAYRDALAAAEEKLLKLLRSRMRTISDAQADNH